MLKLLTWPFLRCESLLLFPTWLLFFLRCFDVNISFYFLSTYKEIFFSAFKQLSLFITSFFFYFLKSKFRKNPKPVSPPKSERKKCGVIFFSLIIKNKMLTFC